MVFEPYFVLYSRVNLKYSSYIPASGAADGELDGDGSIFNYINRINIFKSFILLYAR